MPQIGFSGLIFGALIIIYFLTSAIKILREYERGVIFRLGRLIPNKGPGLIIIWPIIDKLVKVDLRTVTFDVPAQDIITQDNISVKVNAVVYFRVIDPTQRSLDELLSKRDELNAQLQKIIDDQTEPWGIKVTTVEVKNVDLPSEMLRAIAKQAEAERERRAKIIHAEGEFQASQKLSEAAAIIAKEPTALQLRFLQTLTEVATIDLLTPFIRKANKETD
jgi:regulator of protease activity HflC (stomatin/prohibitin superfamily)